MSKSAAATRRRRITKRISGREARPLVFPAQRQAARAQAARLGQVASKLTGKQVQPQRRLPRPVVWLLWLAGAALASVLVGFLAGLARPRSRTEAQV